jgi:hypothetical protein
LIDKKIWLPVVIVIVIGVAAAGYQITNQTTGLWQPINPETSPDQNNPTSNSPYSDTGTGGSGTGGSGTGGSGQGSGSNTGGTNVKITVEQAQTIAQDSILELGAAAGTPELNTTDNTYKVPIIINGEKVGVFIIDANTGKIIELQGGAPIS